MWTISLPLAVPTSKTKTFALNLNNYRNAHHHISNKAKVSFSDLVLPVLTGIPKQESIQLKYELYAPTAGRRDLMNIISVTDKFFSDVLPKAGIIEDDCANIIPHVECIYRGIDRANPRVDVTIIPLTRGAPAVSHLQEGPAPMGLQLTIGQVAIEAAIRAYYVRHILDADLSLVAGRGDNGFSSNLGLTHDQIEDAIREAVAVQLPGLTLDIKLHATRGPEGFTAVISAPLSLDPESILNNVIVSPAPVSPPPILSAAPTDQAQTVAKEAGEDDGTRPEPQKVIETVEAPAPAPAFNRKRSAVAPTKTIDVAVITDDGDEDKDPEPEAAKPAVDIFKKKKNIETEPAEGNQIDLEEAIENAPVTGGSTLEDPIEEMNTAPEVQEDLPEEDVQPAEVEKPAVSLFRRPTAKAEAASDAKAPNKLFGRLNRPDNSHLDAADGE